MINRVQAFNNKNNYNQNFGMAVEHCTESSRRVNAIVNELGEEAKATIMSAMQKLIKEREGDRFVRVIVTPDDRNLRYTGRTEDLTKVEVCELDGSPAVVENRTKTVYIGHERGITMDLQDRINEVNEFAAKAERVRAQGDVFAGAKLVEPPTTTK